MIVGAGLVGPCAALELERRGGVTIPEAETAHVGGRVRTLRFEGGKPRLGCALESALVAVREMLAEAGRSALSR